MNQKFLKFKKRMQVSAILRAVMCAVGVGLLVAAVWITADKLNAKSTAVVWCALTATLAAAAVGVLVAWLLRPTNKKVAKHLDMRLDFQERLQTMIAFEGEAGDVVEVQRADTARRLDETAKKQLRTKNLLPYLIPLLIAAVLFTTAFVIPGRVPETPTDAGETGEPVDVWELTDWHITAVRELIAYVKDSDLEHNGKLTVVETLEQMLTDLAPIKTKAQMKPVVTSAMVKINRVSDGINTYSAILSVMNASANPTVKDLATAIGKPSEPILETKYQELKASFTEHVSAEETDAFAAALSSAVGSAGVPVTDPLYLALKDFSDALSAFADTADDLAEGEAASALSALFDTAAERISAALMQQGANRGVTDYAIDKLMEIFDILWGDLPDELKYPTNTEAGTQRGDYQEKEDEVVTDGGLGGGDVIYGSDDAVYDPETETHVKYGDVIDDYDAIKTSELADRPLSDELKDFIDQYFAGLYYKNENKN